MKHRHRGFALYTAVMIGMLITGVLSALTMGLATDVRRTARLRDDAQMTQLLLAGMHLTEAKLADGSLHLGDSSEIPLPSNLQDAVLHVKANLVASTSADVTVIASYAGKTRAQRLLLESSRGGWRTVSAELSP